MINVTKTNRSPSPPDLDQGHIFHALSDPGLYKYPLLNLSSISFVSYLRCRTLMADQVDILTLPDLLLSCTRSPDKEIGFLSAEGVITTSVTYSQLFKDAQLYAHWLISAGLQSDRTIVVASFSDHESHIKLFWACCLG